MNIFRYLRALSGITVFQPEGMEPDIAWSFDAIGLLPNLMRFGVAAVFLGSFLVAPARDGMMKVIERILESKKPVFTLLFGAIATGAQALKWAVQHFYW